MNVRILPGSILLTAFLLAGAMVAAWLIGPLTRMGTVPLAFAAQDCNDGIDNDGDFEIDEDGVPCNALLTGTVQYYDGTTAVSGASVTLFDTDTGFTYATTSANTSGNFTFSVRPGNFTVSASFGVASADTVATAAVTAATVAVPTLKLGQTAWDYCGTIITTDCVQSVKKGSTTIPSSQLRLVTFLQAGSIQLELLGVQGGVTIDGFGNPLSDLTDFGFSTNDTFTLKVLLKTYQPKGIMGTGNPQSWSYNGGSKLLTMDINPLAASYPLPPNQCAPNACANQADVDYDGMIFIFASDFSDAPAEAASFVDQFNGGYMFTNANYVTMPLPDVNTPNTTAFSVGAPHLRKSGVVNTGFFKVFWPNDTLQNFFGFSDLSDVQFDVQVTSGGSTTGSTLTATSASNGAINGVILQASNFQYSINSFKLSQAQAAPAPAPAAVDDDGVEPEPEPALDTGSVATLAELRAMEESLERVFGTDVQVISNFMEIVTGEALGKALHVGLPIAATPKEPLAGELNFTLGNLTVQTVDGQTTATIDFGGGMTVTSNKVGLTKVGGVKLVLDEPRLNFQPTAPDPSFLPGGNPAVSQIGANFALEFKGLPKGASLHANFAKDVTTLLSEPTAKFAQLAESLDGQMGNLADDVAFGVAVDKVGITNIDLGNNKVTLEVSKEWYDAKIAQGKAVLIAKFDDLGKPVPPPVDVTGTCSSDGGSTSCSADFTGIQGGLSVFALVAMTLPPPPASVPTPAPAAAPAAALTPTDALAPLIANNDNLLRVWHFDPATQDVGPDFGWFLYDPRPVFAAANTVDEMVSGQFYWVNVRESQTVTLGGKERTLFAGWNPVTW